MVAISASVAAGLIHDESLPDPRKEEIAHTDPSKDGQCKANVVRHHHQHQPISKYIYIYIYQILIYFYIRYNISEMCSEEF